MTMIISRQAFSSKGLPFLFVKEKTEAQNGRFYHKYQ